MDSALARAARVCLRRGVHLVRAANSPSVVDRGVRVASGSRDACLGGGSHPKKCTTRHVWSIRLHSQSTLLRQLSPGPRIHDCLSPSAAWDPVCCPISWHLFAGYERRSLDYG